MRWGVLRRLAGARRRRRDSGVVAVVTALLLTMFLGFAAFAVDVGHWYLVRQEMQQAADAAALAGVVQLPGNPSGAVATAQQFVGYNLKNMNGVSVNAAVVPGKPGQLKVSVSQTVTNYFAKLFGIATTTITSSGTASYLGAIQMGSPCNLLGYDPDYSDATESASCGGLSGGRYWADIEGSTTDKQNGDPYQATLCDPSVSDNCPSTNNNTDYTTDGWTYDIKLTSGSATIQLFDPAFVEQGTVCNSNSLSGATSAVNPYVTDAATRYAAGNGATNKYCVADNFNLVGGASNQTMSTTYTLRYAAGGASMSSHAIVSGCQATYAGVSGNLFNLLNAASPTYSATVAQEFRNWVSLCTVPTGSYILQVTSGPGNAANRFAIRAVGPGMDGATIAGHERMGIYTSDNNANTSFYLARVPTSGAGQTLVVKFFDVGDASKPGKLTVVPPTGTALPSCEEYDNSNTDLGSLPSCVLPVSTALNGRWITLRIAIPSTYSCVDTDPTDCWFKASFDYSNSSPTDTSAWTASMDGQAVRLIK